jgi:hypothetical protein
MKSRRTLLLALPLILLGLIWHLHNTATAPSHPQESTTTPAPSRVKPEAIINPAAATEFLSWAEDYKINSTPDILRQGMILAMERRETLKQLIKTNPERALQLAIPNDIRRTLPEEVTALLEVPISAGGEFERIVTCYTSEFERPIEAPIEERFVTIGEQRYHAFTFGRRAEMQTKDRISLAGIAIDDALAFSPDPVRRLDNPATVLAEAFGEEKQFADEDELDRYIAMLIENENAPGPGDPISVDGDEDLPLAESAWTEGNKRILYLRVRFADQAANYEPLTFASAQSRQDDVAAAFRSASYGKFLVTTEITDVLTLTGIKSSYVGQGLGTMMNEARATAITMGQAQGADWNYNNYDFYTIVSDGGIGEYAGVAQVGGRKSHLQSTSLRTAGHEFGHNLGLSHAHYNYTSDLNPRGSTPTNGLGIVEYGHRFSMMSAQSGSDFDNPLLTHFTVHEKWRLDWLTDSDFTDITSGNQTGTYRLYQNDDVDATGLRALRVPSGGTLSKYWLSYRSAWRTPNRSSDNDYLLNGIVFDWTGSGGGTSTLLDMTPYSDDGSTSGVSWTKDNNDKWDAPLIIGRTYTDPDSLVSVTPVARGGAAPDEYLDVYVHLATGSETTLVSGDDSCRVIVPDINTATGLDWTAPSFDDSTWPYTGALGVGYDTGSDYLPYFNTDIEADLRNEHETCYIRVPFTLSSNPTSIASLKLKMRFDDGFVAYLNGVKIASANAPASPAWNSGATSNHSDSSAVVYQEFSANAALASLTTGTNILAIHGLNNGTTSSDFLIQPELIATFSAAPNDPPSVTLAADTLLVEVGQDVTFTASGNDPNGDTLAYAWDFDIGDTFAPEGLNQPLAVRQWNSAGLYTVTIACSDRKGGIARDRVLVKVGNPANDSIVSGRVLRGGQPVAGARVFINGTDRQTLTLADGSYLFGGLSTSSSTTIAAMFDGEVFQSTLAMPVTPQPALEGVDFLAHSSLIAGAPSQALTLSPHFSSIDTASTVPLTARLWNNTLAQDLLIPLGDTWSYLDTGVAPDTTWIDPGFDDSSWLTGTAELGYGDSQNTTVSFGANSANKHITTWFRRTFTANNIAEISRLKLSVKRDDGVRVFLNGTEIARDNLTIGTVSATTKASNEVSFSEEEILLHYNVDPALLIEGENVIAAEIHQEEVDSADLSFDLKLSASRNLSAPSPTWSVTPVGGNVTPAGEFSATAPGTYTVTATSGALSATSTITVATDNAVTISTLTPFLRENATATSTIQVSRLGSTSGPLIVPLTLSGNATSGSDFQTIPASITIAAGATSADFTLTILNDSEREGPEVVSIIPAAGGTFTLGDPAIASVTIIDDENLQTQSPDAGPDTTTNVGSSLPLTGTISANDQFITQGDYWKFSDNGAEPTGAWQGLPFADASWQEGLANFGYGDNDETTAVSFGTNSSSKHLTTYFRRRFYLSDSADYSALTASLLVDDGAVIYLNSQEVQRINMPAGTIDFSTRASNSVGGSDEDTFFDWALDPADLVAGENIIVLEVHQSSPTSSDLGFDLSLTGALATPPATASLWIQSSGSGTASFTNDQSPTTSVTFDQPGTYVLTLTSNGQSDQVTITVEAPQGYPQWVTGFTLSNSDPLADPDLDGLNNLLEFATVSNPSDKSSNTTPKLAPDPLVPDDLLFTYRRIRESNSGDASGTTGDGYRIYGINYTVEASTVLTAWQPASGIVTLQPEGLPIDNGDGSETVTLRLTPPANSGNQWFARLRVVLE